MPYKRNFPDFITAYIRFTSYHEAQERVHLWSCLSMLAASLERKVFMKRGYFDLIPNLYVFIVGASGIVKKSTSTGIAVQMLRDLETVHIMSDRMTASSLIEQFQSAKKVEEDRSGEMHEQASMFIYASELIVVVKEVFGSVVELLTTFWDCPKSWVYKTKHSGTVSLKNVCLNMLAASTIQWMREGITSQIMAAGFAGRVIFVCINQAPENWVAWPELPAEMKGFREKLLADLRHIHSLRGEMKVSEELKNDFSEWYGVHMDALARDNQDDRLSGYLARKGEMILKVAMLKSISEGETFEVTREHFNWAKEKMDEIEPDLSVIYPSKKGGVPNEVMLRVLSMIRTKPGISVKQLQDCFKRDLTSFDVGSAILQMQKDARIIKQNPKRAILDIYQTYKMNEAISNVFD